MAQLEAIGSPANDSERAVLRSLRERLPDEYRVIHSFEIVRQRHAFEIDVAVVAPHAVYLLEVKGTRGAIESDGRYWYMRSGQTFASPLRKLEQNAKG